jgi:hypothetical protein
VSNHHSTSERKLNAPEGRSESIAKAASLGWPEAVGLTILIAFIAMLAAGWFNVMLPWVRYSS